MFMCIYTKNETVYIYIHTKYEYIYIYKIVYICLFLFYVCLFFALRGSIAQMQPLFTFYLSFGKEDMFLLTYVKQPV